MTELVEDLCLKADRHNLIRKIYTMLCVTGGMLLVEKSHRQFANVCNYSLYCLKLQYYLQ